MGRGPGASTSTRTSLRLRQRTCHKHLGRVSIQLRASRSSYANKESVVADTYIQSQKEREDGASSLKRQKMRRTKSARPVLISDEHRRAGIGKLDYAGCATEAACKKRIEDFWEPPEPGLLKRTSKSIPLRTLAAGLLTSDKEEDGQDYIRRRHSHEPILLRTPESASSSCSADHSPSFAGRSSIGRLPLTPDSPSARGHSPQAVVDDGDITKKLQDLLATPDDKADGPSLGLSTYTKEKFQEQEKERKVKERAAAIHASKERRLSRRNPLRRLVQPLSEQWEEKVYNAQYENSQTKVLTTAIRGTELRRKDFHTLLGNRSWLNDEIINAYIEWVEDAANKAAALEAKAAGQPITDVPKFLAHNSFFYETLKTKGAQQTERLMKRKKAPGTSFMQVDTMFVPICEHSHWTIGVVRPIAKTIEYFDSMGGTGQRFIGHIRKWLKFQLGDAYVEEEWKVPRASCAVQNNGYDCGVFVCTNSFCVAFGLHTSCYTEMDMTQQRRNIAAVLLNRGFVGDFAWGMSGL